MSAFGGLILTNRGRNLQIKAQTGVSLNYTRISIGDGNLGGSSILDLNALKQQVKSLAISKLKILSGGRAIVGTSFSNNDIVSGFYYRELGVFAMDPDLGEILYCYANAGVNAEYIPAGGGADIIEKALELEIIIGNASNVTATLNSLLQVSSVNGQTGDVVLTAEDVGAADEIHGHLATEVIAADGTTLEEFKTAVTSDLAQKANQTDLTTHANISSSTTVKGHVQLSTATNSTSTTTGATSSAVKSAYDLANTANTTANNAIPSSQKGVANGVASLGADGKVPASQINATAWEFLHSLDGTKKMSYKLSVVASGNLYFLHGNNFYRLNLTTGVVTTMLGYPNSMHEKGVLFGDDTNTDRIYSLSYYSSNCWVYYYSISTNTWNFVGNFGISASNGNTISGNIDTSNNLIVFSFYTGSYYMVVRCSKNDLSGMTGFNSTHTSINSHVVYNGTKTLIGTKFQNLFQQNTHIGSTINKILTGDNDATFDIYVGNNTKQYLIILCRYSKGSFFIVYDSVNDKVIKTVECPFNFTENNNYFFTDGVYIYICGVEYQNNYMTSLFRYKI